MWYTPDFFAYFLTEKIFCMTEAVHSAAYNENYKG